MSDCSLQPAVSHPDWDDPADLPVARLQPRKVAVSQLLTGLHETCTSGKPIQIRAVLQKAYALH